MAEPNPMIAPGIGAAAANLVTVLAERGLWVATAESCTGGLIAAAITSIPGSSAVFGWGLVTYANEAKAALLGVRGQTLVQHGAVSEQTALEMATGVRRVAGADIGIATTGVAGPDGGTVTKPVGLVWVGVASAKGVRAIRLDLTALSGGDGDVARQRIRHAAATRALQAATTEARAIGDRLANT